MLALLKAVESEVCAYSEGAGLERIPSAVSGRRIRRMASLVAPVRAVKVERGTVPVGGICCLGVQYDA